MRPAKSSRHLLGALAFLPVALLGVTGCPADDCECVDEDGDGFCTASCSGDLIDCDDTDAFVFPGAADHHEDGYDFDCNGHDLGGVGAPCSNDTHCTGICNVSAGVCVAAPEDCRRRGDEDGDGLADCSDIECAAECVALTGELCAAPAMSGTTQTPPTSRLAENVCNGFDVATAYQLVPGQAGENGQLTMWVEGGSGTFELRTEGCGELGLCFSGLTSVAPLQRIWPGGEPLWVVVPGAASHTLYWSYASAVCGDGTVAVPEQCDDGNLADGDGCSASCQLELDFDVCGAATPLNLGITTVSTLEGTMVVETECGPMEGQRERAFALPVTTGRIRVAWSADAPVVLSPRRSDCAYLPGVCEGPALSGVVEFDLDQRPAEFLLIDGAANVQLIIEVLD